MRVNKDVTQTQSVCDGSTTFANRSWNRTVICEVCLENGHPYDGLCHMMSFFPQWILSRTHNQLTNQLTYQRYQRAWQTSITESVLLRGVNLGQVGSGDGFIIQLVSVAAHGFLKTHGRHKKNSGRIWHDLAWLGCPTCLKNDIGWYWP